MRIKSILTMFLVLMLAACEYPVNVVSTASTASNVPASAVSESANLKPSDTPTPTPTTEVPVPSTEPLAKSINPLTGLPVTDPSLLNLPPVLVSISNFPPTARPAAGISFCPFVYEFFIGEGMNRFLGVFYGQFPPDVPISNDPVTIANNTVGPIRSGRIPFEYIRAMFNGYMVMASAAGNVRSKISDYVNVFGSDLNDDSSSMMNVNLLKNIAVTAKKELGPSALSGILFDDQVPEGRKALSLWVYWSYLNQAFWRYDETDGRYFLYQDDGTGGAFVPASDRLTGAPLGVENVIIVFAKYRKLKPLVYDIELMYVKRNDAVLFRDGVMQKIFWTTSGEEYEKQTGKLRPMRFVDNQGEPVALKPGHSWVIVVPEYQPLWETVNSEKYHVLINGKQPGSGYWGLFLNPPK